MKAYMITPHKIDRQNIIVFVDDNDTVDDATRKAARESLYFRNGHPHTIQRVSTFPDKDWSIHFKGNGAGRKAMNLKGLTIEQALAKAEEDNFISGQVTHFERPFDYVHK